MLPELGTPARQILRKNSMPAPLAADRIHLWPSVAALRRKIVEKDAKGKPIYGDVAKGSAKARAAGMRVRQERAAQRAADVAPIIAQVQAAGATSLHAIAEGLNARKIPTSRGNGEWTATQVMRVLERLDPFVVAVDGNAANSCTRISLTANPPDEKSSTPAS